MCFRPATLPSQTDKPSHGAHARHFIHRHVIHNPIPGRAPQITEAVHHSRLKCWSWSRPARRVATQCVPGAERSSRDVAQTCTSQTKGGSVDSLTRARRARLGLWGFFTLWQLHFKLKAAKIRTGAALSLKPSLSCCFVCSKKRERELTEEEEREGLGGPGWVSLARADVREWTKKVGLYCGIVQYLGFTWYFFVEKNFTTEFTLTATYSAEVNGVSKQSPCTVCCWSQMCLVRYVANRHEPDGAGERWSVESRWKVKCWVVSEQYGHLWIFFFLTRLSSSNSSNRYDWLMPYK